MAESIHSLTPQYSKPLRVAIIGCGRITQRRHLPILHGFKSVAIEALVDTDQQRLSRLADLYHVERRYSDHLAMLRDGAIDAVLVCTPPADHFVHARDVLNSGRHLYVEAPLALTAAECQALVELGSKSNTIATVGMHLRYHPMLQRARRCIRADWLGPVQAIAATYSTPARGWRQDPLPSWRQPDSTAGSVFIESAIHHFDTWSYLADAAFDEISVHCAFPGGPAALHALMRPFAAETNADPIVVSAVFSEYAGDNSEVRLIGRQGNLALSLYRYDGFDYCPARSHPGSLRQHVRSMAERARRLPQGLNSLVRGGEFSRTFQHQLSAFVQAARGDKAPLASLRDGKASTIAALAAVRSADSQQIVRLATVP